MKKIVVGFLVLLFITAGSSYAEMGSFTSVESLGGIANQTPVDTSIPVPIPSPFWLLSGGLFVLVGLRRPKI